MGNNFQIVNDMMDFFVLGLCGIIIALGSMRSHRVFVYLKILILLISIIFQYITLLNYVTSNVLDSNDYCFSACADQGKLYI